MVGKIKKLVSFLKYFFFILWTQNDSSFKMLSFLTETCWTTKVICLFCRWAFCVCFFPGVKKGVLLRALPPPAGLPPRPIRRRGRRRRGGGLEEKQPFLFNPSSLPPVAALQGGPDVLQIATEVLRTCFWFFWTYMKKLFFGKKTAKKGVFFQRHLLLNRTPLAEWHCLQLEHQTPFLQSKLIKFDKTL